MLEPFFHRRLSKKINEAILGTGLSVSSMLTSNSSFGVCIGTTVAQQTAHQVSEGEKYGSC